MHTQQISDVALRSLLHESGDSGYLEAPSDPYHHTRALEPVHHRRGHRRAADQPAHHLLEHRAARLLPEPRRVRRRDDAALRVFCPNFSIENGFDRSFESHNCRIDRSIVQYKIYSYLTALLAGRWGQTAGTGYDNQLKQAFIPTISNDECRRMVNIVSPNMLCTGYPNGGHGVCFVCSCRYLRQSLKLSCSILYYNFLG